MRIPFLTATWSNLVNVTYRVPPELLLDRVPAGVELDVQDGYAFVSLVAFDFLNTRVLGVPWPGFRNFPELNLRFYVKHGQERGVVFYREYVPQRFVAAMARWTYNEPYVAAPMRSRVEQSETNITFELGITELGRESVVRATGRLPAITEADDSLAHYFKEHKWGFGRSHGGRTLRYEVDHPVWQSYPVENLHLDVDFGALYGPKWAFLANETPYITLFAVGSPVAVYPVGSVRGA